MAGVELNNITKVYPNGFKALENLNLSIKDKEFLVLVGSSGCGKSTILRTIAGLEDITSGELKIGDRVVNNVHPKDRNISMVFQDFALYPHLSVYDNMAFSLKLKRYKKDEINKKINEIAKTLEIDDILDKKPSTLSGGQKQRVALGRAIIRDPEVFLFDEPLSNIDAKLRMQTRIELIKLHRELKTTFIYVTHDQTEAMTMGDRIVVLNDGEIQQIDTPENLYNHPCNLFTAGFIGTPQMNFIGGELCTKESIRYIYVENKDEDCCKLQEHILEKLKEYEDQEVILGIRPEDFTIIMDDCSKNKNEDVIQFCDCKVEAVELLGHEKLVYMKYGAITVLVKTVAINKICNDEKYGLCCNVEKIHIFSRDTERNMIL